MIKCKDDNLFYVVKDSDGKLELEMGTFNQFDMVYGSLVKKAETNGCKIKKTTSTFEELLNVYNSVFNFLGLNIVYHKATDKEIDFLKSEKARQESLSLSLHKHDEDDHVFFEVQDLRSALKDKIGEISTSKFYDSQLKVISDFVSKLVHSKLKEDYSFSSPISLDFFNQYPELNIFDEIENY